MAPRNDCVLKITLFRSVFPVLPPAIATPQRPLPVLRELSTTTVLLTMRLFLEPVAPSCLKSAMPVARAPSMMLLRMSESWTPSRLMDAPPPAPLARRTFFSITAFEMIPSPPCERSALSWIPLAKFSVTVFPRITGRSALFDT